MAPTSRAAHAAPINAPVGGWIWVFILILQDGCGESDGMLGLVACRRGCRQDPKTRESKNTWPVSTCSMKDERGDPGGFIDQSAKAFPHPIRTGCLSGHKS